MYIVLFGPVKPELGVIPSGITDKKTYSRLTSTKRKERYSNHKIYLLPRTPKTPYGTIEANLVFKKQRVNP